MAQGPGAMLERFSSLRGAIFERFGKDFRALANVAQQMRTLPSRCPRLPSPDIHAREEDTGAAQEEHLIGIAAKAARPPG